MSLLEQVETTLAALALGDEDQAAAELTRLLAGHIDGAAAAAARADKALRMVETSGNDVLIELVQALKARVAEGATLDKLGARVLATLVELQATPKSRGAKAAPPAPGASPLAGLRLAGGTAS